MDAQRTQRPFEEGIKEGKKERRRRKKKVLKKGKGGRTDPTIGTGCGACDRDREADAGTWR